MAKRQLIFFLFLSVIFPALFNSCISFALFSKNDNEVDSYPIPSELHFIPLPKFTCSQIARIDPPESEILLLNTLRDEINNWIGTPFCIGGTSNRCIDCSALVQQLYKDVFDVELPRTSWAQMQLGQTISRDELKAGDLIFFRISNRRPYIRRHVGIYLSEDEFVHSSNKCGVTISNLTNPYWEKAFWKARRVDAPPNLVASSED